MVSLSQDDRELRDLITLLRSRPRLVDPKVAEMRERFDALADLLPAPPEARCQAFTAGGVAAEWVAADSGAGQGTVLYLHGGGYVLGSIDSHRNLAFNLARASGHRVLLLDYRLAPEAPFPAALDDALAGYRWLLDQGNDPATITIAGDSAGGGLAVATLVAIRDQGLPTPACGYSLSPWVDMEAHGASMVTKADEDPLIQREGILWFAKHYLNGADPRSPLAAPLHADLAGLPPLLIQVGTAETLLDDALGLAEKARGQGVTVTLEVAPDMVHVWPLFAPMLRQGHAAIERAGAFVREFSKD